MIQIISPPIEKSHRIATLASSGTEAACRALHRHAPRRFLLLSALLILSACDERTMVTGPAEMLPGAPPAVASVSCAADIEAGTLRCSTLGSQGVDALTANGGMSAVILGGQGEYVRLTSSNITVVADTFAFDVTVTNLIQQALGTTDGSTNDPAGVRVFFADGPTSTGSGTMKVANADGTGTFTAASQAYFQYNGVLTQDAVSPVRRWQLWFSPEVTTFTFTLYVSAAVQYPNGYVNDTPYVLTLDPSESRTLPGTVRSVTGRALAGETVAWVSNSPGTASVTGSQVTAGGANGFATLTATSGARPATYATSVSVCPATVVASGANIPSSIASNDCFSSYGDPNGRPTTSYYADLYRVTLVAGQTITVEMDSGDDLDTYLLLASPVIGSLVAGNDDDDEGILGVGSRMVHTATESGVFVIEASTFNGADTGNYTLRVTIS